MYRSAWAQFLVVVLALGLSMVVAAVLSPALQALLAPIHVSQLHRIFNRLTMIGVLATTAWLLVRNGLATREILGYALPAREFTRQALIGLGSGLVLMMLILIPLFALDVREWNQRLPGDISGALVMGIKALLTGCGVALVEETFFRGAVQGTMTRAGSIRTALFAVPLLYSAIHFFGEAARVPFEQVTAGSGFTILAGFLRKFADPAQIADAFVALYFVGVLLALIRHYTGSVAACIGLHAGIVAVVTVIRKVSSPVQDSGWSFLVGSFDHLLGIWVAAIALMACIAVWRIGRRAAPLLPR